jgi:hypothetical protein
LPVNIYYDGIGGVTVDKEKMKEYVGYSGLGLVGGYIGIIIYFGWSLGQWNLLAPINFYKELSFVLLIQFLLNQIIGGFLGFVIIKKWWGAIVGGFVLNWVAIYSAFFISS